MGWLGPPAQSWSGPSHVTVMSGIQPNDLVLLNQYAQVPNKMLKWEVWAVFVSTHAQKFLEDDWDIY